VGNKTKIACFGASVTKQKTGYATLLESILGRGYEVSIHGYGGMYLNDAAVIYINEVLEYNPDLCIVDWFSTQYENKIPLGDIEVCLETIIRRFSVNKCKLLFLFLPRIDTAVRVEFYKECLGVLKKHKMKYLDLRNEYDIELGGIIRDYVHTTERGSELYAQRIVDIIKNEVITIPKILPPESKYSNIESIKFVAEIYDKLELSGECNIIGMNLTIGPYSGMVELGGIKQNTWDNWCYYERENIKITNISIKGSVELKILDDGFNRSGCKKPLNWGLYKRKIVLHEIFYVGSLKIGKFL